MSARRRRNKKPKFDREELSPFQQAGFTESDEEEEARLESIGFEKETEGEFAGEWKDTQGNMDGVTRNAMLLRPATVPGSRVPLPRFIGHEGDSDIVTEFADGRKFLQVVMAMDAETVDAIAHGMICLRCLEPQPFPDADEHLPGCEGVALAGNDYMKKRQRIDFMAEFEGEKHYGPARPIQAFLDDQQERQSKRKFIEECIQAGRQVPVELLEDPDLFPNGPPKELLP